MAIEPGELRGFRSFTSDGHVIRYRCAVTGTTTDEHIIGLRCIVDPAYCDDRPGLVTVVTKMVSHVTNDDLLWKMED